MSDVASRDRGRDHLFIFLVVTFLAFAIRDGLTGVLRYSLSIIRLDVLWFIPDFMCFAIVGIFAYQQIFVKRNLIGTLFVVNFIISLIIATIFMQLDTLTFLSSLKSLTPIFVGFAFYNRSATEFRWARVVLILVLILSVIGVLLNPYMEYPWVGLTTNAFGVERTAGKLWWASGEVRYGGFAGDSTMAAFTIFTVYVLLSPYFSRVVNFMMWPVLAWAIYVTTSKTALGVIGIYFVLYIAAMLLRDRAQKLGFLQGLARLSFVLVIMPPILILAFGGFDLSNVSNLLSSMSDRIDNTWRGPFLTIAEIFPLGLLIGCGAGCYAYPMTYTSLSDLYFPLDNFYMTTYMMLGFPFAIFVIMQVYFVKYCKDVAKLSLIVLMNIYTVTVQCYGPSFATLMVGYVFSAAFAVQSVRRSRPSPSQRPLPHRGREAGIAAE
ncbi:hypothetical protein [Xanthobacter autotrophicus]|jgi:hypothetical protein|uniref:Uncharacterized protein n=1 Tax=Xanthobacter autotrophicus TaxID=280 RepID=A0A6C1KL45_XANAU|nr:hypothetical protein [Xanthobacter autotrophicus]TLX44367.1 hypothetical protein FBQ73_03090 [Xanthobacter autotrophicus]